MTKQELFDFMANHKLGVLGYLSTKGQPRAALVGIAISKELEIVFDTVNTSRKYGDLHANPVASFVIGSGERTVQYEGEALEPAGDDLLRYREIYFGAWPDGVERLKWPGIAHFVVRPKWIRFSDYDQRPPLIEEFIF